MHKKHIITSAFVVVALAGLAIPGSAAARGAHVQPVRMEDRCDPATFNADQPVGPGLGHICDPHGGDLITFAEFLTTLNPTDGGDPHWRNNPNDVTIRAADSLSVTVRGGEGHTFTEVPEFGHAGCIAIVNLALGLTDPPSDDACFGPGGIFATTGVPPNGLGALPVAGLSPGVHKFMCFVHPWMRTVVHVER